MLVSLIFSLVIVAILTIDIFALERVKSFLSSNYLTKGSTVSTFWVSISDNFRYYMLEELSIRFFILLCFSIYITFKFFKKASHLMFLLPALGGFILILPLSFHPYHYFMSAYPNFVIFVSVSLGLFFKEKIFKKIKELTLGFFLNTTLAVLFVIMFILDVPSAIDKFRGLRHFTFVSSYPRKKAVLELLSFSPFPTVYIPINWEAKQYYGDWLKLYGIEKIIKLQTVTFRNINKIVEGKNLVKNFSFQNQFKFWKVNPSGVRIEMRKKDGMYTLGVRKVKNGVVNFGGVTQDIEVNPNSNYIFGGWIKVDSFSKYTNIKIKEVDSGRYICTFGIGGLEGISNWRLLYAFYKPSQNVKEVKFIIAHVPCFKRGEVWIWHPFFYKLKSGVKFLNYNF
ncbi:carbohydrate binding domain-containing protein [bacterium]|nr:carbohydrate binding domain-containing protein [bacterium]